MMIEIYQITLAFAEGLGLAVSPCILPVLPLILGASSGHGRSRPLMIITGFIVSFTIFALTSRQILAVTGVEQQTIQLVSFALLFSFGVVMLVPALESGFARVTGKLAGYAQKASSGKKTEGRFGGLLIGALIGLVWTPCAGPILAVALLQVIQADTHIDAVITILAFSIGAGIPMLMIAMSGQLFIRYVRAFSAHAVAVRRVMGIIIVVFSLFGLSGFNVGEWVVTRAAVAEEMAMTQTLQGGLAAPYSAPEIAGIEKWFNTAPLSLSELKGKVVLVDFWTYSCINCIRTLPYIKKWHDKYKDKGLVIIGVHSPEFSFEAKRENVAKAVKKFGIAYPVAMDNQFASWKNYNNKYWPAHYLIDRDGQVVYTHFGEGNYDITENNIRYLLGLGRTDGGIGGGGVTSPAQTPETYLGTARAAREALGNYIPQHYWKLSGQWSRSGEYIESLSAGAGLTLHYAAKKVFLVMESESGQPIEVRITGDRHKDKSILVNESLLYEVLELDSFSEGNVTIMPADAGLRLYAFTFES
ncbi:MAG TPA: cytochrome c biogenesis protein DipZ [Alphaproteobacteria bacterium]|nr:cytochrome c biogenesis protein DipZ [Alphaproteobacteria bacterium]